MAKSKQTEQLEKFKEAARQLETDDDEARFDAKLKRIAKAKPDDKTSKDDRDGE